MRNERMHGRIHALGNAQIPQVAAAAFLVLMERLKLRFEERQDDS